MNNTLQMKVLIIEDEKPAAEKLILLLNKYNPDIKVLTQLTSIEKSVEYIRANQDNIDLIFQDIQLTDGLSFEIFEKIEVKKPIIFTTAFNEHALEAFKVNSVDYLLKPITFEALSQSMEKINKLRDALPHEQKQDISYDELIKALSSSQKTFKNRFLVKIGEHIKSIAIENIAMFYAEGRTVFILTNESRKFIIDYKLEDLNSMVNPEDFFRVNRSNIVNINYIDDVLVYSKSRLKIRLSSKYEDDIIVSREKVNHFKEWFSGNN